MWNKACRSPRIAAGVLSVLLLAVLLFSAFFLVAEAHHECTGEDCPVCACIQFCGLILRQFRGSVLPRRAAALPILFSFLCVLPAVHMILGQTPVSRKVRLND